VEQGNVVYSQHPRRSALGRASWWGHHHQPLTWLHLQTHLH